MPGGPTKLFKGLGIYGGRRRDWNPLAWGVVVGAAAKLLIRSGILAPALPIVSSELLVFGR